MALGAVLGGLRMAGTKALPYLAKAGSPWVLRGAGALGGAAPGLMRGDLGQAVVGGGLGGLSTVGLGKGLGWLGSKGAGATAGLIGRTGIGATKGLGLGGNLAAQEIGSALAGAAIPVGGALLAGRATSGFLGGDQPGGGGIGQGVSQAVGGGGNFALQGGAGWVAHNRLTGETIPLGPQGVQDALAPGMGQYGPTGAMGTILDQVSPTSPYAGRRLGTKLDSKTNAEALNILMPTILKWSEETKRRDLARDMQAAGIRQNIATNAALNQIAAQAGADRGTTASSQLGGAITNKYSFG